MVLFLLTSLTLTLGDTVEPISNMKGPAPELYTLPLATSRFGLPESYEKAHELFAAAKKDYEDGKPEKAAPKFMTVAELVKAPSPPTNYSAAFAKMRATAYKDAAIAFEQAGDRPGCRKALTAALKADPENSDTLKALLSKFS
ncbi:MAG: hypothetical protein H6Q89_60 [Myxococcaceae bacterium]|nr:hypothetical protein [Myxococcaceae bacterium]